MLQQEHDEIGQQASERVIAMTATVYVAGHASLRGQAQPGEGKSPYQCRCCSDTVWLKLRRA